MTTDTKYKSCDECMHGRRDYADGYIYRDWSGRFEGDPSTLPTPADPDKFWTYVDCKKNAKKLMHINLDGKCSAYQQKK